MAKLLCTCKIKNEDVSTSPLHIVINFTVICSLLEIA